MHAAIDTARRRIRIYNVARDTTAEGRETIRRAARRESQLIETLGHPGILQVESLTEHDLGPALIFRHDPEALRLDHFLAQKGAQLNLDTRLNLSRQIAEALKYAHEKRVVHRALSPQSIAVSGPDSPAPKIKIFNWQAGYRAPASANTAAGAQSNERESSKWLTATLHPERFVEDASIVYVAPEAFSDPESLGEHLDVFSLGAIAYHVFSGQVPAASSLELAERLRANRGLQISAVMDGAGRELQELIQFSTHPEVSSRLDSASDFLELLGAVEEELTRPDDESVENPLEATAGDVLAGGFRVKARLGSGSSAIAFLVERDGKETVLKLARSPDYNARLRDEYETIRKLHHSNIVAADELVDINNLTGFTMQRATAPAPTRQSQEADGKTLAGRLRVEGRLHLELLERFGEDLLEAVSHLEEVGIQHRDIKPDNIGIRPLGANTKLRLVLFDFSLSRTPADNIRAGTAGYIDPFLNRRQPPRWDSAAERFAAAVTLYEMTTGMLPRWGDGQSNPEVLDCEVTLEPEFFDPNLRDAMLVFFRRALRRDYRERFHNAEEMLREWRRIFEVAGAPATGSAGHDDFDRAAAIADATLQTQIIALGLSTRAANALDRFNATTVKDLLSVPLRRLYRLRGVGSKTRREVADLVNDLRARFPEVGAGADAPIESADAGADAEPDEPQVASVDLVARQVINSVASVRAAREREILQAFLGWEQTGDAAAEVAEASPNSWRSQIDVARDLGLTRARVGQVVTKARARWRRSRSLVSLRETIAGLIETGGGAMTRRELTAAVLAARGSEKDEPVRSQLAHVITRAAVEAERGEDEPRYIERRAGGRVILARDAAAADYAARLGDAADWLADRETLPTPARAVEVLRDVEPPAGDALPLNDARLINLAAAVSERAAVSARMEIYPRGMRAERALKLAHGALFGRKELTVDDIGKLVAGRYPEAEPVPARPQLDCLLDELNLELKWRPEAGDGRGAYVFTGGASTSLRSSSTFHVDYAALRRQAQSPIVELPPKIVDARTFDRKLRRAEAEGAFLALSVAPRALLGAEAALLKNFVLERRDFDEMLITTMREQARSLRVEWATVLRADAAPPETLDWRNLGILISRSLAVVEERLSACERTILLVYPGLLARYRRMDVIERLRDRIGVTGGSLHGLWVLMAADERSALPALDGVVVPVIGGSQYARIPEAWIANAHHEEDH